MTIRVVVVDDSALVRSVLGGIINAAGDMRVVGMAPDPHVAREMIRELNPDVITLDVEMPHMDGLDFLERLMRLRPMPVVMVSTLTARGAEVTLRALELGAVEFVSKPQFGAVAGLESMGHEVVAKVRAASMARVGRRTAAAVPVTPVQRGVPAGRPISSERIVAMGASTGGTEAIRDVLRMLPADGPGVVIAQHMPSGFTASFAGRLDGQCAMRVKEAQDGEAILRGHAYIAPGGLHLRIRRQGAGYVAEVNDDDPVNRHRPSVDVLFHSVAQHAGCHALGVMLTGMGADGARGMRAMRDAGAYNVVQDEASCVVFGMPREAIAAGAADAILPLQRIGAHVLERMRLRMGNAS